MATANSAKPISQIDRNNAVNLVLLSELVGKMEEELEKEKSETKRSKKTLRSDILKKVNILDPDGKPYASSYMRTILKEGWKRAVLLNRFDSIPLMNLLPIIRCYLESHEALSLYPDFPKRPVSAYNEFRNEYAKQLQQQNPHLGFVEVTKACSALWSQGDKKEEYEKKYKKKLKKYKKRLEKFYDNHTNLLAVRKAKMDEERRLEKINTRLEKINKTQKLKKEKEEKEAAFNAFLAHKAHYAEKWSMEKNSKEFEAKMRRKFEKFSEEKLDKYRQLAGQVPNGVEEPTQAVSLLNSSAENFAEVKEERMKILPVIEVKNEAEELARTPTASSVLIEGVLERKRKKGEEGEEETDSSASSRRKKKKKKRGEGEDNVLENDYSLMY